MNQKGNGLLIAIIAILVIGGGWLAYSQTKNKTADNQEDVMIKDEDVMMNDDTVKEDDTMMDENKVDDGTMMKDEPVMMEAAGGEYVAYQSSLLSRADSGDVVLFFRASWCPTCRVLDKNLKATLNDIPKNLTILDVNYDDSSELKNKYGVTYQHTLVQVDAQGNQIAKWSGGDDLSSIVSNLK